MCKRSQASHDSPLTRFGSFASPDGETGTSSATAALELSSTSTLKLSFAVPDSSLVSYAALILSTVNPNALTDSLTVSSNSAALNSRGSPDQSLHRANAQASSVSIYLAPKKASKYRWEWDLSTASREDILNVARLGEGSFKAQIFLSPTTESGMEPTLKDVGSVHIADQEFLNTKSSRKYPREWEMDRYSAREELRWTFREARKPIGGVKALIGLVLVLSPWALLAALVRPCVPFHILVLNNPATDITNLAVSVAVPAAVESTLPGSAHPPGGKYDQLLVWLDHSLDLHATRCGPWLCWAAEREEGSH